MHIILGNLPININYIIIGCLSTIVYIFVQSRLLIYIMFVISMDI